MPEATQSISIECCPKCGKMHKYPLIVRRSLILSLSDSEKQEHIRTFTCLFTCPSTGEAFQAEIVVKTPSIGDVESVQVGYPMERNEP
jgi:hypothetical protein